MRSVKVNKHELLAIVHGNREKHIAEYAESVEDYARAALKISQENLKLAKTGDPEKIAQIKSLPQRPTSYEDNYTRAIRMLELSVDTEIELEEDVFNQLVLDEWTWKHSFVASASLYKTFQ